MNEMPLQQLTLFNIYACGVVLEGQKILKYYNTKWRIHRRGAG